MISTVDGRAVRPSHVRLPGRVVLQVHWRCTVVTALLLAGALAVAGAGLLVGNYQLTAAGVVDVFAGGGGPTDRFIVLDQRLPRASAALLVGAALGLAGTLFQSVSRNPLASPDVIGFTTGSASGALVILLVAGSSGPGVAVGALGGGLATAVVVYLCAAFRGIGGQRLVVVGIAVGAMLASVNDFLLTRADQDSAEVAKLWLFGSLNAITWPSVLPLAITLPVLSCLTVFLGRSLRLVEMGDDVAAALGVRVERTRLAALTLGIALTGAATATAGPIGFLALAAPQVAHGLTRCPGVRLVPAAAAGALLLACADLAAQRVLSPFQIPVGLVTGALGGAYLVWLLGRGQNRSR